MIIYATKQTLERYKLKLPETMTSSIKPIVEAVIKRESKNELLEWGAKLFYFDGKKCIQIVNFASKFTLFLINVKVADLDNIGALMEHYLFGIYKDDKQVVKALKRMFANSPVICFAKLTDKSAIATLNTTQIRFADDGYRFYEFIEDGILKTMEINRSVNLNWLFTMKTNGKMDYFYAGERFRDLVLDRYGMC